MKKWIALMLALLLTLSLAACGGNNTAGNNAANNGGTANNTQQDGETAQPTGDGHYYGGTLVVATALEPTYYQTNYQWDGGVVYISHNINSKLCYWDEDT